MLIPALGATVATLPSAVKNAHSHRAIAAAQMLSLMRARRGTCDGLERRRQIPASTAR
jgi:hypothetical protein